MGTVLKVATVVRADDIREGDLTLDGEPITSAAVENDEVVEARESQKFTARIEDGAMVTGVTDAHVVGDAPETVTLRVGKKSKEVSPSDMIVVLR